MPGILQSNANQAPVAGANQSPGGPAGDEMTLGDEQSTPEEQDYYDRIVLAGDEIIFGSEEARKAIVEKMKVDAQEPAKALADATALLVIKLDEQTGGNVPEAVILPAATELLEHMAELADSLGLFPIDDAVANHAGQLMVGNLSEAYGMTPEDMQAMVDSVPPEEAQQIAQEQGTFANKQPPQGVQ
tara:strand:+ start:280 stop:840 length:561 start_codon:yes stop_codon:yes gene_type:complete